MQYYYFNVRQRRLNKFFLSPDLVLVFGVKLNMLFLSWLRSHGFGLVG